MGKRQSGNPDKSFRFIALVLIAATGMLLGCTKGGGVCVSSSGPITKQSRNAGDFNQIEVNDNVNLILTADTTSAVIVEAGQNIIDGITTKTANNQLVLHNTNSCNWLRDYRKPINIYLSAHNLWKITYNGVGNITTKGTIVLDSLNIEVWGGSGTISLLLDIKKGNFSLNMGTVDFRLTGTSAITSVYTADYGLYDGRNLNTEYTFITSKGSNDCYVNASYSLEATINSIGNIYYTGNPTYIKEVITGAGQLIPY